MTCIIAVETKDNNVVMAGDNLGSNGHTGSNYHQPKVFKHSGMMFGYTSTFRFGQIIEVMLNNNSIHLPATDAEVYPWLVNTFVPKVRDVLKQNDCSGGNMLIGVRGQVWEMQGDFSVLRAEDGYNSVGSGEEAAKAALGMYKELGNEFQNATQAERVLRDVMNVVGSQIVSVSQSCDVISLN